MFLSGYDYLNKLKSFQEGLFYVQDISSMTAAKEAGAKEQDVVLDLCAAPGGKSIYVAQKNAWNGKSHRKGSDTTESLFDRRKYQKMSGI